MDRLLSAIACLAKWLTPSQARETYENDWTRSITIHRTWCGHLRKHGGNQAYGQGRYMKHETIEQAFSYGCFRHQLLLARPYLPLAKALTPDFRSEGSCQRNN